MAPIDSLVYQCAVWGYRNIGTLFSRRAGITAPDANGTDILGFHNEVLGIGETARQFTAAFERNQVPSQALPLTTALRLDPESNEIRDPARVLLSHLNPPELMKFFMRRAPEPLRRSAHVGYWVWELETPPRSWKHMHRILDAIWTPSEFSARAIRKQVPSSTPVDVLPPPIFAVDPAPGETSERVRNLPGVKVLAICDLRSTSARKNPLGSIRAFLGLAPEVRKQARLVLKLTGLDSDPMGHRDVMQAIDACDDVEVLTDTLSDAEMIDLIASSDIAMNLHRSEGFGLLPAHAAFRGVPVITTNWAAPAEFLTPDCAMLVPFERVRVSGASKVYSSRQFWAEPSVEAATEALSSLVTSPELRQRMGEAARRHTVGFLGEAAWLTRYNVLRERVSQVCRRYQRADRE